MNGLVVGLRRQGFDDLEREAHAKGDRLGGKLSKRTVVVAAAAAEASAATGEGESGDQEAVDGGDADPLSVEGLFESPTCVRRGLEVMRSGGRTPEQIRALDEGKNKAFRRVFQ